MDALWYLNKALDMEETGYTQEALELMKKVISAFPDQWENLFLEQAKMKFRSGFEKEALLDFITLYENTENEEWYRLIMQAYYEPNLETLEQQFRNNLRLLEHYPHYSCRGQNAELTIFPLWQDEETIICINTKTKQIGRATCRERERYLV